MVGYRVAVWVDDEDVPLAVNTLLGVVVGDGLLQAEGDVEVHGLLHEGLGVGGGVGLAGAAFVPAGAEGNAVVDHHPGVLGLHNARGGIGIGVVEPGAVLVGGGGDGGPGGVGVGSQSLGDVLAHQVGVGGMSDDGLVLIDDEDVPLAVNALLGVVVGDGLLQAEGDVEVHGLLHEGLGVGGGVGLAGAAFVPAGAEGNAVVDHHPGVLGLHNARGGIGIGVVEPGAVLVGGGGDGGPGGVGVGSQSLGDVLAHQVGVGGMSDDGLVLIDDEDVPLAVNTLLGVVVGDGGI
ncbi:hypothetical protein GBAR_LOCUS4389 [Geodia barretti]|uniref:Uncharacterized protein n=2 Tax=Geodia barretti TaxID=519541 RepID=A0AA35R6J9_GEOBA|nr:hypothetical protein GBAR_LOCUS4389 [Geodia barretti]